MKSAIDSATFCDMWSSIDAILLFRIFESELPTTPWLLTTLHPYGSACDIDYPVNKLTVTI